MSNAHLLLYLFLFSSLRLSLYLSLVSVDGIEATLRLRARESAHYSSRASEKESGATYPYLGSNRLIIIGMSANSDAETKRLAHEAGMQYFLPKPFTIAEFIALLDTIKVGGNGFAIMPQEL